MSVNGRQADFVDVYYARLPLEYNFTKVYPSERQQDVDSCSNQEVRAGKYYVWKLLEYAINKTFGIKIQDLNFEKTENGKWVCKRLYFSLSHTKGAVAVCVSNCDTGVDIELIDGEIKNGLNKKVLNEFEESELEKLDEIDKFGYFIDCWAKKESQFKRAGERVFVPKNIDTQGVFSQRLKIDQKEYALAVSTKQKLIPRRIEKVML